jgi:tetratricopeptide (TPR) repeat protein
MAEHDAVEPLEDPIGATADAGAEAIGLALAKKRAGGKGDPRLDAVLEEQARFLRLQSEHLHEQRELQVAHLKVRRWKDRLSLTLQVLAILAGAAVLAAVGAMAWTAHEDHGVAIEAFSVPPDLAQRGLTGEVVASKLLDRLAELQARTVTARPASTYANDWGGDIKVEIPETGVSIGELNHYLHDWLGGQTRISGEVVRTPQGLAVTARAGASAGSTFTGPDADLDRLIQQAAESVYHRTQPYRWAVYLASTGRRDEASAAYAWLAEHGGRDDRAWAYTGWATMAPTARETRDRASTALALDSRVEPAWVVLNSVEGGLGHDEAVLSGMRAQLRMLQSGHAEGVRPGEVPLLIQQLRDNLIPGALLGDFKRAVEAARRMPSTMDVEGQSGGISWRAQLVSDLAQQHDIVAARQAAADPPQSDPGMDERMVLASAEEDWSTYLALRDRRGGPMPAVPDAVTSYALALAQSGRLAEAEAMIAPTPMDCARCLARRGMIRALAGDRKGADRWLAEAARLTPSTPQSVQAWGWALLQLGDADAAIAKAKEAHKRGPRWADPLELWGEALLRKGDYAGAAAKFAEADDRAPNWGRNHLRWGEALLRAGRYAEARAQFEAANSMGLSRPDRAALDVFLNRTARGPLHG